MPAEEFIQKKLDERRSAGIYRSLRPENDLVDLCSNDYLGFARSVVLKDKIDAEIKRHTNPLNGSTGSRLISGNLVYTENLEKEIATYHNAEAGLMFNSGYDANLGLFSCLPQRGDTIILDDLIHASIIDGARLSYANRYTFKHNDIDSLEDKLRHSKGNCYVGIESIYSMDGDNAPVKAIAELVNKYNAHLIVDEAHAVGIYPKGMVGELGLEESVFARVVTFGKALGCHGAIVLGGYQLRNYLINFARSFIYTTAASFHQVASVKMAYELLLSASGEVITLKNNIALFRSSVKLNDNYPLIASDSPIQCLLLKSNVKAKEVATNLQLAGFDVRPIMNPTVAAGTERIRICIHSFNTKYEIALLADTINKLTNA